MMHKIRVFSITLACTVLFLFPFVVSSELFPDGEYVLRQDEKTIGKQPIEQIWYLIDIPAGIHIRTNGLDLEHVTKVYPRCRWQQGVIQSVLFVKFTKCISCDKNSLGMAYALEVGGIKYSVQGHIMSIIQDIVDANIPDSKVGIINYLQYNLSSCLYSRDGHGGKEKDTVEIYAPEYDDDQEGVEPKDEDREKDEGKNKSRVIITFDSVA